MKPFVQQPVPDLPLLDRGLRLPNLPGAEAALVNLLAGAERAHDIAVADIVAIEDRYRLEPGDLTPALRSLFARLLTHYVADGEVSDAEVEALVYLKEQFGFTNREARELHDDAAAQRYRAAVDRYLTDRVLTDAERESLERLRDQLLLSDERARLVATEGTLEAIRKAERELAADLTLSPTDAVSLEQLADNLGVDWPPEGPDRTRIERLRRHWELDRLPLSNARLDVKLPAGEIAHLTVTGVQQRDLPPAPVDHPEVGTAAAEIADLLRWLFSSLKERLLPEDRSTDGSVVIDSGNLTVTNRNVVFTGKGTIEVLPITKIRELRREADRLVLKVRGKPWPLVFEGNEDLAAAFVLIRRLIREDIAASAQ